MKPRISSQRDFYEILYSQSDAYEALRGTIVLDHSGRLRQKGQPIIGMGAWYRLSDGDITGVCVPAAILYSPSEVIEPTDDEILEMALVASEQLGVSLHATAQK